jgi:phosphoribosylformimino-5-aminoimidazole carboxamide ribotide isomerase
MIAVPAVDLRDGRCVQLVGGRPEEERVSLPDPVAQARGWWEMGFGTLHIVDLDAALSLGDNRSTVQQVIRGTDAEVQVGGGVRDRPAIEALLGFGATRVIVGTRAIAEASWLRSVAEAYPGRVTVAADIRDGEVVTKGWTESTGIPVLDFVRDLDPLPIAGILCTDVSREGRMEGIDLAGATAVVEGSRHPVWVSGGITTLDELRALDQAGAVGAVLGMALYTGVLPPTEVAREFGK